MVKNMNCGNRLTSNSGCHTKISNLRLVLPTWIYLGFPHVQNWDNTSHANRLKLSMKLVFLTWSSPKGVRLYDSFSSFAGSQGLVTVWIAGKEPEFSSLQHCIQQSFLYLDQNLPQVEISWSLVFHLEFALSLWDNLVVQSWFHLL